MAMLTEDFDALAAAIARSFQAIATMKGSLTIPAYQAAYKAAETQTLTINQTLRETYPQTFQSARFLRLAFDGAVEA